MGGCNKYNRKYPPSKAAKKLKYINMHIITTFPHFR